MNFWALFNTNANLKISLYVCVHTKIVTWQFGILNIILRILVLFAREVCKFFKK